MRRRHSILRLDAVRACAIAHLWHHMLLRHLWRLLMLAIAWLLLCLHHGARVVLLWAVMRVRVGGRLLWMVLRVVHGGRRRGGDGEVTTNQGSLDGALRGEWTAMARSKLELEDAMKCQPVSSLPKARVDETPWRAKHVLCGLLLAAAADAAEHRALWRIRRWREWSLPFGLHGRP